MRRHRRPRLELEELRPLPGLLAASEALDLAAGKGRLPLQPVAPDEDVVLVHGWAPWMGFAGRECFTLGGGAPEPKDNMGPPLGGPTMLTRAALSALSGGPFRTRQQRIRG